MGDHYTTLATRIRTGVYADGSWLPSERALAVELGVARSTLRRILDRLTRDGFLECLPGCRPVVRAGGKSRNFKAVALLMGRDATYRPFSQILRGCELELRRAGYLLVYLDTWAESPHSARERAEREREALESLVPHAVTGLIIWCQEPNAMQPVLQSMIERGMAVVTLDREVDGLAVDHAGVDNYRAAEEATEHLVKLGHRRIGFAAMPESERISTSFARQRGFVDTLARHGLPVHPEDLFGFPIYAADGGIANILRPRIGAHSLPTAFFAVNDLYAACLVDALHSLGLRVPQDVSVVGFDNVEAYTLGIPFLTTVEQPFLELGRAAARLMLQRLAEPSMVHRHVLLETRLIERSSAAPPGFGSANRPHDTEAVAATG